MENQLERESDSSGLLPHAVGLLGLDMDENVRGYNSVTPVRTCCCVVVISQSLSFLCRRSSKRDSLHANLDSSDQAETAR